MPTYASDLKRRFYKHRSACKLILQGLEEGKKNKTRALISVTFNKQNMLLYSGCSSQDPLEAIHKAHPEKLIFTVRRLCFGEAVSYRQKSKGFGIRQTWVWTWDPSVTCHVSLESLLNLPKPRCCHLPNVDNIFTSEGYYGDEMR